METPETPPPTFDIAARHLKDTPVAPANAVAAIALDMAMRYHQINTVSDGVLYQQYKMEGRNMETLNLDMVFETAIRIEQHLLAANERVAKIVVDAIVDGLEADSSETE